VTACDRAKGEGNWAVGDFPLGWTRAVVRTTGATGGVQAFVIVPDPGADNSLGVGGLSVSGAFRVEKKLNSAKAANEVWADAATAGRNKPAAALGSPIDPGTAAGVRGDTTTPAGPCEWS
jgi:hypothetical protein